MYVKNKKSIDPLVCVCVSVVKQRKNRNETKRIKLMKSLLICSGPLLFVCIVVVFVAIVVAIVVVVAAIVVVVGCPCRPKQIEYAMNCKTQKFCIKKRATPTRLVSKLLSKWSVR